MKIAGKLLFDFSVDGIAEYLMEVILEVVGAFGDAASSLWDGIWESVVVPFVGGTLIDDGFWIGLLMIWLFSTMIVVEKAFGWRK